MSDIKSFREISRGNWGTTEQKPNNEQITLGAILRIADAVEIMSKEYSTLAKDRDYYKKVYFEKVGYINKQDRRIAAFKGYITKLKNDKKRT